MAALRRRLSSAELAAYDPLRPANWRMQRAMEMLSARPPQRPTSFDDRYTTEVFKFLRRMEQSKGRTTDIYAIYPAMWCAYRLYSDGDEFGRTKLEARILAGQTNEEIASWAGTWPETIELYEAVYFCVRDRIKQKDWILRQIYGPNAENLKHNEAGAMIQLFAYHGGPVLLELLLSGFDAENIVEHGSMSDFLDKHVATTLRRRTATALMTAEVNRFNIGELVTAHQRLVELTRDARAVNAAGGMQPQVHENIVGLLHQISWLVGSGKDTKATLASTPAGRFTESAVQLRADDELAVAFGEIPVESLENQITKRLPPPRTVNHEDTQPSE